jgi:hypothetical protein
LNGKEQLIKGGTQYLKQGFVAIGNSVSSAISAFYGYSCPSAIDGLNQNKSESSSFQENVGW